MGYLPEYYDEKIKKAKRAIVFATILIFLIIGLIVAAFLVNMFMFDTEYRDQLQPYTIYPRKFTVYTSNSDIEISFERTTPSDICLLRKVDYDNSESTGGKFDISIAKVINSTTFEFSGHLDSGEYILYSTSVPVSDTVNVKITVDLLSPILLYVIIATALLIGLLLLRIGLKVRRIKILNYEKENEAVRPGSKPAPGWGGDVNANPQQPIPGWGSGGGGRPQQPYPQYQSQQPIYQQSVYERTPAYSKDDLQFFANVGEGSEGSAGGSDSGSEDGAVYAATPSDSPNFGEPLRFETPEDTKTKKGHTEPRSREPRQQPKRPASDDAAEGDEGWGYVDEDELPKKQHHAQDARPSKKGASTPAGKDAGEIRYTLKGDKEKVSKNAPEPQRPATAKYNTKADKGTIKKGEQSRKREPRPPQKIEDDGADGYLSPDDI